MLPDDPRAALGMIAGAVTSAMKADRPVIRVVLRDLEQFPDLLAVVWDGLLSVLYRELTDWLSIQQERGHVAVADPGATAAVLLASLTYYRILDALIGRTPGDVDLARFLAAWVDSAAATIHCTPGGKP